MVYCSGHPDVARPVLFIHSNPLMSTNKSTATLFSKTEKNTGSLSVVGMLCRFCHYFIAENMEDSASVIPDHIRTTNKIPPCHPATVTELNIKTGNIDKGKRPLYMENKGNAIHSLGEKKSTKWKRYRDNQKKAKAKLILQNEENQTKIQLLEQEIQKKDGLIRDLLEIIENFIQTKDGDGTMQEQHFGNLGWMDQNFILGL